MKRNANGDTVPIDPKETIWWSLYIESPKTDNKQFCRKFRRRFRCKYDKFLELLEMVKQDDHFLMWTRGSSDCTGKRSSPVELLLLGSLRYLGRGFTFDDCEENTAISEETHRRFFHVFILFGASVLFPKFVERPINNTDSLTHQQEFLEAGMDGCIGSTDATHVAMLRCPSQLRNFNNGFKLDLPSRTYNLTTNHRRQILSTTTGHPGRWNDKTLVLFDDFVKSIYNGKILQDVKFSLFEHNANGEIVQRHYTGAWLIVDNGYLEWSTTVPPFKNALTYKELRWSKWIESMRKDVECVFGILKGRFRVLKTGVRLHGLKATDRLWLTCCALHNFLLLSDGLNGEWRNGRGVVSDYQREFGQIRREDMQELPPELQQRSFDLSGMGNGNDVVSAEEMEEESVIYRRRIGGFVRNRRKRAHDSTTFVFTKISREVGGTF